MAADYPDGDGHVEPYAGFGYREPDGSQSLKAGRYPEPVAGAGYGTQDDPANDHRLSYGHAMRPTFANDHSRATAAGKPDVRSGEEECDPFDTVPGIGASDLDKAGRPGGLPDPVYRKGSGTTQRP